MGYIGNLVSDLKGAASIRGRMYKSVRQTPSFQERGYAFAYNLGTISSLTGLSFGRARGGIYDGLQFQNTVRAALHPTQNSMRSLARRGLYKGAAFAYGRMMNNFIPVGTGPGGRMLRVAAGRFTAARLRRFDTKVRNQLYAEFKIDGKKIDDYVKNQASQVGIDFLKIQKGMQAIAISNAPDPYAIHRFNRSSSDGARMTLGRDDQIMSAFSLRTFDDENIEALMSRKDIRDIMGTDALAGAPNSLDNLSTTGFGPHRNGRIIESLYGPSTGSRGEFDRDHTPSMTSSEAYSIADLAMNEGGFGAEYAFGNPTGGAAVVTKMKEFIAESLLLADKLGPDFTGPLPESVSYKIRQARALKDKLEVLGPEGIVQLGKSVDVIRYLHGDDASHYGSGYNRKYRYQKRNDKNTLPIFSANAREIDEEKVRTVKSEFIVEDYTLDYTIDGTPIKGPIRQKSEYREKYKTGRKIYKRDNLGGLRHHKDRGGPARGPESPIHRDETLLQTFTDNPQRHNFVPNKRQIQSAIHSLKPDTSPKGDATVEYVVAFGGKNPNSRTNDAIRDAYQIEYGGPATDKQGKLRNRTDMFVFTPSLFMYRSALGAAKAFGLEASSGRNIKGHVTRGLESVSGSNQLSDVFVKTRGVSGPAGKKEKAILEELYEKAAKRDDNPIFQDGMLMLSKNKVLSTAFDTGSLDLASDALNDTIFGGRALLSQMGVTNRLGERPSELLGGRSEFDRRAFTKVVDDRESLLNQEKAIHRLQKELGRTGQQMPTDELMDRYVNVGGTYDDVPPPGVFYDVIFDENGNEKYVLAEGNIQGSARMFGQSELPIDDEGKPFIPGQVINARSKKNVTSLDSALDYSDGTIAEDIQMLSEMDRLGISGPDDPEFLKLQMRTKISRNLQYQNVAANIEAQFRTRLAVLGNEFQQSEIQDFAARLTNNLMGNLRRKGIKFKYAGGGESGIDELSPAEVNLITEFFGAQFETLNSLLSRTSYSTRNIAGGGKFFRTTSLGRSDRTQQLRDAATTRGTFDLFADETYRDQLIEIFSYTNHIEDVIAGNMDINKAVNLTRRRSQLKLGELERKINNPITEQITDVSGKKRARVDIKGSRIQDEKGYSLNPGRRTGEAPEPTVNYTGGNAYTSSFRDLVDREERQFGLRSYSTAAQLKYVQREIRRLEQATDRQRVKQQILNKCEESPFIKSAFLRFISQDSRTRNMGMDSTVNAIREYLNLFYDNIGLAPPDF